MIGAFPLGVRPLGVLTMGLAPAPLPVPLPSNVLPRGRRITLVEVEAASTAPVSNAGGLSRPLGAHAIGVVTLGGAIPPAPVARPVTTVRAADLGYRSSPTDAGGVRVWQERLVDGLAVDRTLPLLPSGSAAGAAWGQMRLLNMDRALTAVGRAYSPAGRALTVRWGYKGYDAARGYETDPAFASLGVLFRGVGQRWRLGDRSLDIELRDASYFGETPLDASLYGGTGGLEGPAEMAGKPKPKLRGGTAAAPVRDIEPVLVDPTALIYQINDARAVITTLYESGDGTRIPFQANVSSLYSGTTNPGQYRTDQARGLFQLGRAPAGRITLDAYGATLSDNFEANAALLALAMLYEDLGLPVDSVEQSSLLSLAPAWPHPVGWYWRDAVQTGIDAAAQMLASINAALIPRRDGRLAAVQRRPPSTPVARYTDAELVEPGLVPVPADLAPPPWRWRIGHTRCHTMQSTQLPDTLSPDRTQFLAAEDRIATWFNSGILAAYPRATDPPPIASAHLTATGGQALADALGALWTANRELFDLTLPLALAARHELGETLLIVSDAAGFEGGRNVLIVGERLRTQDDTATLRVMA